MGSKLTTRWVLWSHVVSPGAMNPWCTCIYIYNVTVTLPMLRTMTPPPPPAYRKLLCPGPHTALRRHWITSAKGLAESGTTNFLFPEKRCSSRVYLLIKWFSRLRFHTWQPSRFGRDRPDIEGGTVKSVVSDRPLVQEKAVAYGRWSLTADVW